ncbi:zinc-dependent alcohol dehydrogenase [Campylobacter volucris]|uniref:Zinc-dependent alcohol dehydrogenase n=1 Tax=Campylobacter volucris TaxID=1031542 RepID=A0AAE5YIZ9_9BACT|nr:zinc-dependent alcohol dehydrogenase [Campylobacter volucris]AJC93678.1 zinc-dependent alcohol dehydrogenase [Campylobacter volucris LMG 24379]KAB0579843.1 zinc-dependent alcohol dehydrogenase [Campylobacter volucris]QBL13940.1 zinc-dependent alcohol dehydrogenase [Campylobacter volucris]QEL07891.1 zinc-dependent alcohol dehydrogenase [Campylobacter volucris]TXK70767.1 zinc-dependent alcohol dehydrogenase [Campylobacter volucris]
MDSKIFLENGRIKSKGYAMLSKDAKFTPFEFTRHKIGKNDVLIAIKYSGICHSDIHTARSEWGKATYPCVPGHEIAGEVIAVGGKVSKFKVGDLAGVGCMVNSCGECEACKASLEQFCQNGKTIYTYNSKDVFHDNENTYGGYSNNIVVSEKFAIKVPNNAPLEKVAPLLCAGITTYSPLKFSKIKEGSKVAIAGFGGLGVMALKYAIKMGAKVSIFARNENKKQKAIELGASEFYTSTENINERFDLIISTIPTPYDISAYMKLLKIGGELCIVGLPPHDISPKISANEFVFNANKKIYGSLIGGIKETQEMLDFSIKNEIYPEIELIKPEQIDEAYKKLTNGEAKFRYVIDMNDE